jgi:excisionase family DNA binding protein
MTEGTEYLRAGEIARLMGISVRTVRRWIAREIIPSVKFGGARLVAKAELECLLLLRTCDVRAGCAMPRPVEPIYFADQSVMRSPLVGELLIVHQRSAKR